MNTRIALKYGGISGLVIVASWFLSYVIYGGEMNFEGGELFGYAVMILALTAVFMGIRSSRQSKDGAFTFGEGFMTGLGIVLVASIIYVVGWMIYMPNFAPDFADKYASSQIEMVQSSDASDSEKQAQIEEIQTTMENYKKPHIMAVFTFIEIFPVGLLVTLISALILRRKE